MFLQNKIILIENFRWNKLLKPPLKTKRGDYYLLTTLKLKVKAINKSIKNL